MNSRIFQIVLALITVGALFASPAWSKQTVGPMQTMYEYMDNDVKVTVSQYRTKAAMTRIYQFEGKSIIEVISNKGERSYLFNGKFAGFPYWNEMRNARIVVSKGSAVEMQFPDMSRLSMGENSEAVLDGFTYAGPDWSTRNQMAKVTRGLFRFISGAVPQEDVKVKTPAVTIGVRG